MFFRKLTFSGWAFVIWLVALTLVPFTLILALSLLEKGSQPTFGLHLTLENYLRCFQWVYAKVLWKTLLLSLGATLSCLAIGFPVAYYLARSTGRMKHIGLILLFIPFWTNFILRIQGIMSLLGSRGLLNQTLLRLQIIDAPLEILYSQTGVYIGLVYNYLPFMVVPIFSALEKLDKSLREAAYDLGASRLQTFVRVVLPNIKEGMIIGSVFVFIPMLGEYVIPDLLGGAKEVFLGRVMVDQFFILQDWPFGSAIAGILSLLLLLVLWFQNRWQKIAREVYAPT